MKKSNECKAEFDYVAYHYVKQFVHRWHSKISRMQKGKNEKNFVFDKFINEYIIYSALVNVIKPQEYKHKCDCIYCTKVMAEYIAERISNTLILKLSDPVNELIKIIDTKQFKVVSSKDKNPELKENWLSGDPRNQLSALLETLYYMRCNLFHGQKEYSDDQIFLLKPAFVSLSMINKEIEYIFSKIENRETLTPNKSKVIIEL